MQLNSFAQANPTTWNISTEKIAEGTYQIKFHVALSDVWAIYSQHLESDEGPVATSFRFEENEALERVGEVEELGDKIAIFDELFEMNIIKYKHEVTFVQTVKAAKGTVVKGTYEFMVCNNERCLPPREEAFEVALK